MVFSDRADAGRRLAGRLGHLHGEPVVVLGLPRGGVPVALEVARALGAPLDVIVVRKLGVPFQPELGMGAIGEGGVRVLNRAIMREAGLRDDEAAAVEARERAELERRVRRLRGGAPRLGLQGRVAVVVDDGVATGSTARAACQVARALGAARVVLAVPVAPPGWETSIGPDADELICLQTPDDFFAIGQFYGNFRQVSEDEVAACLQEAGMPTGAGAARADDPPSTSQEIEASIPGGRAAGCLSLPETARGLVVVAHASSAGRHSPRSRYLSFVLRQAGLGTLLVDLLTRSEQMAPATVFNIGLLARRLAEATRWARAQPGAADLPVGYVGAQTAAAAALWAAAEPGARIAAVVCPGGRPDLADARLASVVSPTLLIVARHDEALLRVHRQAQARLRCESRLALVPGYSDLLDEPGALAAACELALGWITSHLAPATGPAA